MNRVLFWIRASHPGCKCRFQVILEDKKEIVSSDAFNKIVRDAKFLNYPIICLN